MERLRLEEQYFFKTHFCEPLMAFSTSDLTPIVSKIREMMGSWKAWQ